MTMEASKTTEVLAVQLAVQLAVRLAAQRAAQLAASAGHLKGDAAVMPRGGALLPPHGARLEVSPSRSPRQGRVTRKKMNPKLAQQKK